MKPPQFFAAVLLAVLPLILVISLMFMGKSNQALQTQLQKQQENINKGSMSQQIGVNLLKEIAAASVKDDKLKDVLAKSGYSVTVNASPSASPAASPANP